MKQQTLTGFEKYGKTTRRAQFLGEMDRTVPWRELAAVVEPVYPKVSEQGGRPPLPLERMLRVYFLQLWFNLSDPAVEEALYDSAAMRAFAGIDLGAEANVADALALPHLLHGNETRVWGDQAYRGQKEAMRKAAPRARDFTNQGYRRGGRIDEVIKARNRTKSRVRAKVEHTIGVIKRVFGFQKVRYRGLAKNLHRLEVSAAMANLFMMRRRLMNA